METKLTTGLIAGALGDLLQQAPADGDRAISGVVVDSREVRSGELFVALRGEQHDGNDFVPQAAAAGAAAVLGERLPSPAPEGLVAFVVRDSLAALQRLAGWWRRRFTPRVVAVTGSVGKTTTKEIAAALLSARFVTLKSAGNQNNEIGLPLTLLKLAPEYERVALEMGMYARGEIRDLCRIALPQVGIVTCVRPIHLDRLGSIEAIASAKAELPEELPPDGLCVLNADDERVAAMAARTAARVMTYGIDRPAGVMATDVTSLGAGGMRFRLVSGDQSVAVDLRLPGRHQVSNALAAACVALAEGMPVEEVAAVLSTVRDELRLRVRPGIRGTTLLDDTYNAGPDSMAADLAILADTPGRKVAVLGDMLELGSIEQEAHLALGRQAAGVVDLLYTIGPRARWVADGARAAGHQRVLAFTDKGELAAALRDALRPGDCVLLKASHALALETVVAELKEENGEWSSH